MNKARKPCHYCRSAMGCGPLGFRERFNSVSGKKYKNEHDKMEGGGVDVERTARRCGYVDPS